MMVGEHFLFIKLRNPPGFPKDLDSDPKIDGVAPAEELRILAGRLPKALWEKAVVPYKPPTPTK
jgi:hypothetical protein